MLKVKKSLEQQSIQNLWKVPSIYYDPLLPTKHTLTTQQTLPGRSLISDKSHLQASRSSLLCAYVCINLISYDLYHKKGHGASSMNGAILDIGLIGQVIGGFDWHFHSLHCEKRSQIRCV